MMNRARKWWWVTPCGLAMLGACAPIGAVRDVAAEQHATLTRLGAMYADDLLLMRDLMERALGARRLLLLGELHRGILLEGYITPGLDADTGRLDADLGDAAKSNPLLLEVRTGRMSADDARAFLRDYALVLRLTNGDGTRADMLSRLAPIADHDAASESIRRSFAGHAELAGALLADANADALAIGAIGDTGRPDAFSQQTIRAVWARTVLDQIDDPSRREAAARLLERVLTMGGES